MTGLSVRPRLGAASGRRPGELAVVLGREAVVLGALAAWVALLAGLTWGRWGDLTMDTGYDMLAASRTAGGELPYADYVYFYGPLAPLALGGVYAVTGASVGAAVAFGLVLAALAVGLTYRLARVFAEPLPAGLAAALTATAAFTVANNSYVVPHAISAPLSVVLALAALLALLGRPRDAAGGRAHLLLAGVLCGLTAITRLELAVPFCLAVAAWLGLGVLRAGPARRAALRDAAAALVPAALVPLAVYGAFLTQVPLGELLWDNLYPRDFIDAAGHVILAAHAPGTPASVAELTVHALAYAAGAAAIVAAGGAIARGGIARRVALVAVAGGLLAFLAVLALRPETVRYYLQWAYAWIPAGAWAAAFLAHRRGRRDAALVCLVLGALSATTYASFLPFANAVAPEGAAYLMPFAAIVLVWLHAVALPAGRPAAAAALGTGWVAVLAVAGAGLALADARDETATVRGPGGALGAAAADAPALQQALDLLQRHTRRGDPVLIAPQLTALYVMADRRDPLPQLSLLPGTLPEAGAERAAVARMGDVRLAITDRTPLGLYEHGAFGTTFGTEIAAWLRRDFRRLATVRGTGTDPLTLDVWLRLGN